MIQSELQYFIGDKLVNVKCQDYGEKTDVFPTVQVLCVAKRLPTAWLWIQLDLEQIRKYGLVANTISQKHLHIPVINLTALMTGLGTSQRTGDKPRIADRDFENTGKGCYHIWAYR
jgi:hypothetical protein